MITAAENIIGKNHNIKKVLILTRIPRFDTEDTDPNHIKPLLSDYANSALKEELENSNFKDQISVASHQLPFVFQENLYGHPTQYNFDGIHLRGPDGPNHYSRSLCNIFQSFLPISKSKLLMHVTQDVLCVQ